MSTRLTVMLASAALALACCTANVAAATKPLSSSQQKMSDCSKAAKGKKGADYKSSVSSCLKGDAPAASKPLTPQEKMKACNADPQAKALKSDARKSFISNCLKNSPAA